MPFNIPVLLQSAWNTDAQGINKLILLLFQYSILQIMWTKY